VSESATKVVSIINDHRRLSVQAVFLVLRMRAIERKVAGGSDRLEKRYYGIKKTLKKVEKDIKAKRNEIKKLIKKTTLSIETVPIFDDLSDDLKDKDEIPKSVKDQFKVFKVVKGEGSFFDSSTGSRRPRSQNVTRCPACDAALPRGTDATFCPFCGASMKKR